MALLFHPPLFSFSIPAKRAFLGPRAPFRFSASAVDVRVESGSAANSGAAILWYKHDLRIEDHPGLIAASQNRIVVPLYVFDRRILSRFSDEMLELLLFALEDLRKLLQEKGSNLMIRFGTAEDVISKLVKEVQASSIFAEEEVEYELCVMLDNVKESLSNTSFKGWNPKIVLWSSPFYDATSLKDLPSSFHDFQKLKPSVLSGLEPPVLSATLANLSWGTFPTMTDLKEYIDDVSCAGNLKNEWTSIKKLSAENMLQRKKQRGNLELKSAEWKEDSGISSVSETIQRKKPEKSAFITSQGSFVGGGSILVLNALAAYLRYLEGTSRDDYQEVHAKLRLAEKREGASFQSLFGSALLLGIISRRRVYFEAIKYEKERNGGFLSPFGYSTSTVAAAINTVSSMEWYWLLTLKGHKTAAGIFPIRIWRWNNFLIQYTVAGHEGPAILLVHGFGAFLEHYRDNVYPIAEDRNRVWAITLLGFGKSEKPNIIYTELMWAELIRDFIIEVVREPVHLVGNSIGGYAVAIVAGLWSSLAKSVVLMNSAGNIIPGYRPLTYSEDRRTSGPAWLGARLLSVYLRFNIRNILRSFYPTEAGRADDWLINEMVRASYDPGVIFVLESIFSFDLSLPLNYLLEGFEKRILVVQGMKDPLSDSRLTLAMFREHCRGVAIKEIDAGHCPHDELPNEVNSIITDWVATLERETSPVASKQLEQS
ncbi:DNA photolyase [Perilla frutescens var. frutescens]|nr:DNA photolyase [Perilla frutescens var. frutescens]